MRTEEKPKKDVESNSTNHPAFAVISLSRPSGDRTLFDSEISHHHYISLTIAPAKIFHGGVEDNIYGSNHSLIEVCMSEAQFAAFITSTGASGSPCTLTRFEGKLVPEIDNSGQDNTPNNYKDKVIETFKRTEENIEALEELVENMTMNKKNKQAIINSLNRIKSSIVSDIPFYLELFVEKAEKVKSKVMSEINAYITKNGI